MKKIIAVLTILFLLGDISALAENKNVKRIEFIAYAMSGAGVINSSKPADFADLSEDDKYYNYAAAAKEHGVIIGYEDNTLKPYEDITRQDAIVILSRIYKLKPASGVYISGFSDYSQIGEYAMGYISAAVRNGIVDYGVGTEFKPQEAVSVNEMERLRDNFEKYISTTMQFSFGYPKISKEKVYNAVSVSVKMSRPCTVYYKLLSTEKYLSSYRPKANEITDFLTAVNIAGREISVNIYPEDLKEYNLYVVAVDSEGNYTDVECIREVSAHRFSVGDGSKNNPYCIYNSEQLAGIKYYPDAFYKLETDIEINGEWEPIIIENNGYVGFCGVLDGNYHKITGFEIKSYENNVGLFSAVYGGTIKNLYIDGTVSGEGNAGIIAGVSEGGTVSRCFAVGRVYAESSNAGGIVGLNNGKIEDSVSAAYIVEAANYAGGIAGINKGDIIRCLSAAYSVMADMYASGAAGANIGGTISYSVCANLYANDVITMQTGRVTTNRQQGTTFGNYCYDKMMGDTSVNFGEESQDGLEASWEELTNPKFYSDIMGWDTYNVWNDEISEDFRLVSLKGFDDIDMIKGLTMYAPVKIYTEDELLQVKENTNYHYILMNDISMSEDVKWEPIGKDESEENGFDGTFDGNNHTISGINMNQREDIQIYGMFGVVSGGTVRNLKLKNLTIEGHSLIGGIAGINYGYIENCSVNGKIYALRKSNMLSAGGAVGDNHGIMENISADVKIRAVGEVLTVGGVVANNDGFIDTAYCRGEINAEQNTDNSNAVAGGIVGINTAGYIYNGCSDIKINSGASVSYLGGICGIMNGGEIYKTESDGVININSNADYESSAYAGGIAGLSPEGLIVNSFSCAPLVISANKVYVGGVVGYNQLATIQNTYSSSMIDSKTGIFDDFLGYAGGICGFSEEGFILDNVSLNKFINTNGYADKVCNKQSEIVLCSNNYILDNIKIQGEEINPESGEKISEKEAENKEFYFMPIAEGGKLGWLDGEVWYMDDTLKYPTLCGVGKF